MLAHKVYKLVQLLAAEELGEVRKFLESDFFNTNPRCVQLFEQLCKFHPTMESPKLTKERLFAKVFGKGSYDDGKMRKLMTQLSQLIERYLVVKQLDKAEDVTNKLYINSLADRNHYELFKAAAEGRISYLEKQPLRGKDYYREMHLLNEKLYYHPETEKLTKGNQYLLQAVQSFEQYFTLLSLENAADILVRNRLVEDKIPIRYLEAIEKVPLMSGFTEEVTIRFAHQLMQLHLGLEDVDLDELKKLAFEALRKMSKYEQSFTINSLKNYALNKSNTGSISHSRFMFDLIVFEIENDLLVFGENFMNSASYMNIVSVGLVIEEFDWVRDFIDRFTMLLPPEEREIANNLCFGSLHYHEGVKNNDLDRIYTALSYYNRVPIRIGLKYDLRVRPAIMRAHFEIFGRGKESLDELLQHARNFERHIQGNDLYSGRIKEQYLAFLRYLKILARIISNPNKKMEEIEKFIERLLLEENVALKSWLLNKSREYSW